MPFEVKYNCDECNHTFYRITEHDPRKGKSGRPPSCPECKKAEAIAKSQIKVRGDIKPQTEEQKNEKIQTIIESKKFPARGGSLVNKCWDDTQKIVAEDYGMTDLNVGSLREGDTMVPKLRPDLEEKVGKGWNTNQKNNVSGLAGANLNKSITANINSNRYANQSNIVDRAMSVVEKPVTNIIGHYRPEKSS